MHWIQHRLSGDRFWDRPAVSLYVGKLVGNLRCFDRGILHGTLIDVAHPGALLGSMQAAGSKPRDLTRFAQPITLQVRDHIIGLARQDGIEIETSKMTSGLLECCMVAKQICA